MKIESTLKWNKKFQIAIFIMILRMVNMTRNDEHCIKVGRFECNPCQYRLTVIKSNDHKMHCIFHFDLIIVKKNRLNDINFDFVAVSNCHFYGTCVNNSGFLAILSVGYGDFISVMSRAMTIKMNIGIGY